MESKELTTEGDINITEARRKWDDRITDLQTRQIMEEDARYFLHQSISTPCLDVLATCKGSDTRTPI